MYCYTCGEIFQADTNTRNRRDNSIRVAGKGCETLIRYFLYLGTYQVLSITGRSIFSSEQESRSGERVDVDDLSYMKIQETDGSVSSEGFHIRV
jgi:hypothetical protein